MVGDPKIAVQAYLVAEPLLARQQGLEVRTLMLSDLGWNPYSSVLVTTGTVIRESPEMVREFVAATQAGWIRLSRIPRASQPSHPRRQHPRHDRRGVAIRRRANASARTT